MEVPREVSSTKSNVNRGEAAEELDVDVDRRMDARRLGLWLGLSIVVE